MATAKIRPHGHQFGDVCILGQPASGHSCIRICGCGKHLLNEQNTVGTYGKMFSIKNSSGFCTYPYSSTPNKVCAVVYLTTYRCTEYTCMSTCAHQIRVKSPNLAKSKSQMRRPWCPTKKAAILGWFQASLDNPIPSKASFCGCNDPGYCRA